MTKEEFRAWRSALGLKTKQLARLLDIDPRTCRRYAGGEPIPFTIHLLMTAMSRFPGVYKMAQVEQKRRDEARDKAVKDAIAAAQAAANAPPKRRRIL